MQTLLLSDVSVWCFLVLRFVSPVFCVRFPRVPPFFFFSGVCTFRGAGVGEGFGYAI